MPSKSGRATRLSVTDLLFHSLFAFFLIELKSRKVIHVGVTRSPTDAWTAQQLREATAFGTGPKYLICDNALLQPGTTAGSASSSRLRSRRLDHCHQIPKVARLSPSRS